METTEPIKQNVFRKIFTGKNAKKNIVVILLFVAAFAIIYYKFYGPGATTQTTYQYVKAVRKELQTTVEGSGSVVSQSELQIQQLQNGGKVTSVRVKPGDFVKQGQIIATLDNRQAAIQVEQAKAAYQKLINGQTPQALAITNQSLISAQASYNQTKAQQDLNVLNTRRNLLNSSISAVSVYDSLIQPNSPTISGTYTCDADTVYDITITQPGYANISGVGVVPISSVPQAIGTCGLYISFDTTKNFNGGEWKVTLPNTLASNYNSNLNAYNSALVARDQALVNASSTLATAQLNLNQQIAPPRPEDVLSAKASLDSANLAYENTLIRAPFDGQIGNVSAIVGQQTNSQVGVATIITKTKLAQISLNEVDIINVKLGQNVDLTFDAIPGETFHGKIYQMDTVGTVSSNVVTFGVKISIDSDDDRIKSGMSVTASVVTNDEPDALTVPSEAIKTEGTGSYTKYYVMQLSGPITVTETASGTSARASRFSMGGDINSTSTDATSTASSTRHFVRNRPITGIGTNVKTYVQIGISNDVDTEITAGLNEGDQVVSKTITGTATASTKATFSLLPTGGGAARGGGGGGFGGGGGAAAGR